MVTCCAGPFLWWLVVAVGHGPHLNLEGDPLCLPGSSELRLGTFRPPVSRGDPPPVLGIVGLQVSPCAALCVDFGCWALTSSPTAFSEAVHTFLPLQPKPKLRKKLSLYLFAHVIFFARMAEMFLSGLLADSGRQKSVKCVVRQRRPMTCFPENSSIGALAGMGAFPHVSLLNISTLM